MENPCVFCLWIILCSFVVLQLQSHGSAGCHEEERIALFRLKDALNATISLSSWGDKEMDCCKWERVGCDQSNHHIIQLSLDNNIASPDRVCSDDDHFFLNASLFLPLRELQNLSLNSYCIEGFHGVLNLSKLQVLDLSVNWFHEIPRLGLLRSLKILNIELNKLNAWSHFEELTTLKHLELLNFAFNQLSGKIPHSLGSLSSLKYLSFMDNDLINGSLTDGDFCELRNLQELDLSGNSFEGRIPSCLANLTSLRVLVLSQNSFTGTLPFAVFSTLNSLKYLSLSFNYFEGPFSFFNSFGNNSKLEIFELENHNSNLSVDTENPPWMPQSQMKIFRLSNCKLNEPGRNLPSFLLKQQELRVLHLSHTGVTQIFPTWLLINNSNMEFLILAANFLTGPFTYNHQTKNGYLKWLDVSINQIQGVLPYSIGVSFPSLNILNMSMNGIQGGIPPSMGELTQLSVLDLSNNNLSGELPEEFLQGCINLVFLNLANNNLQGQVLPKGSNLSSLLHLRLENNHFSGELSRGLLNSTSLTLLDLSNNSITGEIPHWIGYLSQLNSIVLSNNLLQGPIPMSFCRVKELSFLDLSINNLNETIPPCLNVSYLRYLHLHGNEFNGSVPKVLSEASSLVTLDMRDNNLSGRLPSWISSLSNLRFLLLGGNKLEGPIPFQLCDLKNVSILDLSSNNLSSSLPSCLHNVLFGSRRTSDATLEPDVNSWDDYYSLNTYSIKSRLEVDLDFESQHADSDEEEVKFVTKSRSESYKGNILNYMSGIDLSFNNLIGPIPPEIGYLSDIHTLNLSHNHFTGSIPTTFSNLKLIECLDLSHNRLNGQIPQELNQLNFLAVFSVAFNNLSGRIPDSTQFSTFGNSSYQGNPLLCGQLLGKSCNTSIIQPSSDPNPMENDDSFKQTFVWSFIGSYIVAFIASVIAFLCCTDYTEQLLKYFQAKLVIFSF